jgi:hypothetical protein
MAKTDGEWFTIPLQFNGNIPFSASIRKIPKGWAIEISHTLRADYVGEIIITQSQLDQAGSKAPATTAGKDDEGKTTDTVSQPKTATKLYQPKQEKP